MLSSGPSPTQNQEDWKSDRMGRVLRTLVGFAFGPSPEKHLDLIRAKKREEAKLVSSILELNKNDSVIDFGCGLGWVASALAPQVQSLLCLDNNPNFIHHAKIQLRDLSNVQVQEVNYGSFSHVERHRYNKIFALNTFTQFNLYDLVIYLREIYSIMPAGGRFYFNFNEIEKFDSASDPIFDRQCDVYREDRFNILKLRQWHSRSTIEKIAGQTGFSVLHGIPADKDLTGPAFLLVKN